MTDAIFDYRAVIGFLADDGFHQVTWEFPGCVVIALEGDRAWWFGTVNETWCGDLLQGVDGLVLESRDTGLLSSELNPLQVAAAIARTMRREGE